MTASAIRDALFLLLYVCPLAWIAVSGPRSSESSTSSEE